MRRLAPLDKALVVILVPIWLVCFGLSLRSSIRQEGVTPLLVSSASGTQGHPAVVWFRPWLEGRESGLRVGDVLLRVEGHDLRGAGRFDFYHRVARSVGSDRTVSVVFEREGRRSETRLRVGTFAVFWPRLVSSLVVGLSGLLVLLRARPSPMVSAFFQASIVCALVFGMTFSLERGASVAVGIYLLAYTLFWPLVLRAFLLYPHGEPPTHALARWGPWLFAAAGSLEVNRTWGLLIPPDIALPWFHVTQGIALAFLPVILTRAYRRADPIGRRQIRWIVLGAYAASLPVLVASAAEALDPRFHSLFVGSQVAGVCLPLSMLVSVARYNLFDVDRLISATASYNILAVLLLAGALVAVPRIAEAVSEAVGLAPATGQIVLSLGLAALVIPAHRRLRPQIDRVFFKERYALDHGVAALLPTLSACTDARELTGQAGAGLYRLLRPEACAVYASVEESYAPVFVEGRAVPPAFSARSPLIASLKERRSTLSLSAAGRRPDEAALGPFDRAALETLQAEVVVPLRQEDALIAFLCLGPKRSGDVYTSTDLSLLTGVAEKVSMELRRFDQEQTIREAREMQESLRRYVPGAVAEQLGSGAEPTSGERQVSVLFVDIRGYTGFSEGRRAEEIFSTVNRYTETVSRIVQKYSGSVVEFNGDGMMAVFGAPRELAHKERAAVEAGREIVEAVGDLPVRGREPLSVGVGIATGAAFVGNIEAVDRMIWSAIGNTTNLAARLQGLTRELGASLVIDAATWERAQQAAGSFEKRSDVPIRGRRETQDVYALPFR